jgi:hypothetical protein
VNSISEEPSASAVAPGANAPPDRSSTTALGTPVAVTAIESTVVTVAVSHGAPSSAIASPIRDSRAVSPLPTSTTIVKVTAS